MNNLSAFGHVLSRNLLRKKKRPENDSQKKKKVFHMKRFPSEERGEGFVLFREKRKIQYGRTGDAGNIEGYGKILWVILSIVFLMTNKI